MTQLRSVSVSLAIWDHTHSVTCYPTQVNTPRLNPSHAGRYSIYLPRRDGRLSWPSWPDSAQAAIKPAKGGDLLPVPLLSNCTATGADSPGVRALYYAPSVICDAHRCPQRTSSVVHALNHTDYGRWIPERLW